MGSTSSKRVSIKSYLLPYLDEIGIEIGTSDYSEIVHQIITEHKRFIRKSLAAYSVFYTSEVRKDSVLSSFPALRMYLT